MAKLHLISLGCNKNLVDSEIMLGRLSAFELTDELNLADVIIINTCGFIASAKEESIRVILEASANRKKGAILVVTGCLTQRYKEELMKELPEVDIFSGVGDFDKIDEMIMKRQSLFSPTTYMQKTEKRVITGSNFHAYIKISEGCNQKCSFCAIPTFKGRLKSRSIDDIITEIRDLVSRGFYDFSFIAQDTSSYGRDFGDKDALIKLIKEIEKIGGVKFARILYLYPSTTSDELIDTIINSPVFLNYFDMPIQHISDNMLKIMHRGSGSKRIKEQLLKMRNAKDSFLRTGIIIGHPGEEETDFEELCEFLQEFKFDRISAFAYSKEEDTLSYQMQTIPTKIVTKRLNKVEKIINSILDENFRALIGRNLAVQISGVSSEGEFFYGAKLGIWDKDIDGEILINDSEIENLEIGGIYTAQISEFVGGKLLAKIVK